LREGSAVQDSLNPDRIVFGVETKRAEMILKEIFKNFDAPLIVTDIKGAELIKHASNSFLALKISYINAISNLCEIVGADVKQVALGIGADKRIGKEFLSAGIGWGGSCFGKDLNAFYTISKDLGYEFGLLKEVENINIDARQRFLKKLENELWILKGKVIAALGLAFKKNTDDIRDSVAIEIIKSLLLRNVKVNAYDPKATLHARSVLNGNNIKFCKSAYEACKGADAVLILTEWDEFKELDFKKIKKLVKHATIIDGRNILDSQKMREEGFIYRAMGRP